MRNDVMYIDVIKGDDLTVIVNGTPCNVDIDAEGVRFSVWGEEADAPHGMLSITWNDIIQRVEQETE